TRNEIHARMAFQRDETKDETAIAERFMKATQGSTTALLARSKRSKLALIPRSVSVRSATKDRGGAGASRRRNTSGDSGGARPGAGNGDCRRGDRARSWGPT